MWRDNHRVRNDKYTKNVGYSERRGLNDSFERKRPRYEENRQYDDPIVIFTGERPYGKRTNDVNSYGRRQSTRGGANIMPSYRDLINQLRS